MRLPGPALTCALQTAAAVLSGRQTTAEAADKKPNIVILWGDDIGITNISAYSGGVMGCQTPSINRIAREGLRLQHYYGEQSCTAERVAFAAQWLESFREFAPRQKPASFNLDEVMRTMSAPQESK